MQYARLAASTRRPSTPSEMRSLAWPAIFARTEGLSVFRLWRERKNNPLEIEPQLYGRTYSARFTSMQVSTCCSLLKSTINHKSDEPPAGKRAVQVQA